MTHYPLSLKVIPREGLRLHMDYDQTQFESATVETIAARFVGLLDQVAATPDLPVCQFEILSPPERQRILKDFNDTAQPLPEATLPQLFEAQVEQSPEAIALIFGEHRSAINS